jgi:phytoene dehydrogenase-like protein
LFWLRRGRARTLPGFLHDFGSAVYPLAAGAPFFAALPLADYGLEWVHGDAPLAHPLDDGTVIIVERDRYAGLALHHLFQRAAGRGAERCTLSGTPGKGFRQPASRAEFFRSVTILNDCCSYSTGIITEETSFCFCTNDG